MGKHIFYTDKAYIIIFYAHRSYIHIFIIYQITDNITQKVQKSSKEQNNKTSPLVLHILKLKYTTNCLQEWIAIIHVIFSFQF